MDEWEMVERERLALGRDLAGLSDSAWDAPSLCTLWRVRDVVGHLLWGERGMGWAAGLIGMAKNGGNFNRFVAGDAIAKGNSDPAVLLAEFEKNASSRRHPPATSAVVMLSDTLCHAQDIRRPLGLGHQFSEEVLEAVANLFTMAGFPIGSKKRIAGIRLVATDADWTTGQGPDVSGPLEALVMVMAGRRAALADLTGTAIATLDERLTGNGIAPDGAR
jgi:uncharacterized protein (TIGR03083 family)